MMLAWNGDALEDLDSRPLCGVEFIFEDQVKSSRVLMELTLLPEGEQ